jgi:type IV pilus assembly protein PilW
VHSAGKNELDEFRINPLYTWDSRSLIFSYDEVEFFVGRANANVPWSLYRHSMAKATSEPLVENVEDMDVTFGVDTNGDGSADTYQDADTVTGGSNWPNVISVRVALLVRSTDNGAVLQPQPVFFRSVSGTADVTPAASDRYLRQTFTTTIALRNRLP